MKLKVFLITLIIAVTSATRTFRIVGGSYVSIKDYPYQVSVHNCEESLLCGGSIISKNVVITAAHCVEHQKLHWEVRAGSNHSFEGGSTHDVVDIIIHNKFRNSTKVRADIALLRVSPSFEWDETRAPIPLSKSIEKARVGDMLTISGYGRVSHGGRLSRHLKATKVAVVNNKICKKLYRNNKPDVICARSAGNNTCHGDSGGPAVLNGHQIGIISTLKICASKIYPSEFIKIPEYYNWIQEQLKNW